MTYNARYVMVCAGRNVTVGGTRVRYNARESPFGRKHFTSRHF